MYDFKLILGVPSYPVTSFLQVQNFGGVLGSLPALANSTPQALHSVFLTWMRWQAVYFSLKKVSSLLHLLITSLAPEAQGCNEQPRFLWPMQLREGPVP